MFYQCLHFVTPPPKKNNQKQKQKKPTIFWYMSGISNAGEADIKYHNTICTVVFSYAVVCDSSLSDGSCMFFL